MTDPHQSCKGCEYFLYPSDNLPKLGFCVAPVPEWVNLGGFGKVRRQQDGQLCTVWRRKVIASPETLAERAPPPPADLVQATQDGPHPAIGAKRVKGMKAVKLKDGK